MTKQGKTKGAKSVKKTTLSPHSCHIMRPVPEPQALKKRKLTKEPSQTEDGQCDETKLICLNTSGLTEYTPRKRSSKHLDDVESMNNGDYDIKNIVPAFAQTENVASWDDFEQSFDTYKQTNKLKFRVRSSEKTELNNSTHQHKVPPQFKYTHKIYRCTHGVTQRSRSKGHRNRKTRFCKCQARLTVIVSRVSGNQYEIMIRNQTLPLDDQDREGVMTLADARVSSTHNTNLLNDRFVCALYRLQGGATTNEES